MELSLHQLDQIISLSAKFSATLTLIRSGQIKPYLKKSEAYRIFGRQQVDEWVQQRELGVTKDGDHSATWRIDRMNIELIAFRNILTAILEASEN
ncbi:hypothetical protein [Mucilaginibacter sp. SJ]|uniref:hypothetical protein n=1 Tax=Mucilaginibacter sp. SJ TaxID=3029053 RepID=UPI0023A9C970|nr:hypothetical protein [Mucilaginibacter sp. SJ]WEA01741.1 hypothetical protein MusilaSJ_02245 [Mucilaginibacter sp. SJ]